MIWQILANIPWWLQTGPSFSWLHIHSACRYNQVYLFLYTFNCLNFGFTPFICKDKHWLFQGFSIYFSKLSVRSLKVQELLFMKGVVKCSHCACDENCLITRAIPSLYVSLSFIHYSTFVSPEPVSSPPPSLPSFALLCPPPLVLLSFP